MSLLNPLTTFRTGTYNVSRSTGTRVDGLWADGSPTVTSDVPMQITPVSGELLKTLPEGQTSETTRVVRCAFDLQLLDVVTYDGEDWRVMNRRRWTVRGVSYTWAMIARERLGV
jgi:hypothetical protein